MSSCRLPATRASPLPRLLVVLALACICTGCGSRERAGTVVHARAAAESTTPSGRAGAGAVAAAVDATSGGVLVDVSGAVRRPGVYRLAPGSRVLDAITAAGGARHGAQLAALNRAATVVDGQQVVVPDAASIAAASAGVGAGAAAGGAGGAALGAVAPGQRISLATATVADFDTLPGIGPVTAAKLVADRTANGPFASVDDLDRVPGIGPAMVEQLRELVTP